MSEEAFKTHTTYLNEIYNDKVLETWKNEKYDLRTLEWTFYG